MLRSRRGGGEEGRGGRREREERRARATRFRKGRATRTKEDVVDGRLRREPSRSDMWESPILLYAPQDPCVTTFDHLNGYTHSTIRRSPLERPPERTRLDYRLFKQLIIITRMQVQTEICMAERIKFL